MHFSIFKAVASGIGLITLILVVRIGGKGRIISQLPLDTSSEKHESTLEGGTPKNLSDRFKNLVNIRTDTLEYGKCYNLTLSDHGRLDHGDGAYAFEVPDNNVPLKVCRNLNDCEYSGDAVTTGDTWYFRDLASKAWVGGIGGYGSYALAPVHVKGIPLTGSYKDGSRRSICMRVNSSIYNGLITTSIYQKRGIYMILAPYRPDRCVPVRFDEVDCMVA